MVEMTTKILITGDMKEPQHKRVGLSHSCTLWSLQCTQKNNLQEKKADGQTEGETN